MISMAMNMFISNNFDMKSFKKKPARESLNFPTLKTLSLPLQIRSVNIANPSEPCSRLLCLLVLPFFLGCDTTSEIEEFFCLLLLDMMPFTSCLSMRVAVCNPSKIKSLERKEEVRVMPHSFSSSSSSGLLLSLCFMCLCSERAS